MKRSLRERGTASIEFVALIPILLLAGIAALQIGLIGWATTSTAQAARQAGRAVTLKQDPEAAARASLPSGLTLRKVSCPRDGDVYRCTVVVQAPIVFQMVPAQDITRDLTMPVIQ